MFESDLVDLFSRTHPAIVPLLYVPGSALLFYLSVTRAGQSVWFTTLLFAAGFVTWTLVEYWLHRLFFHWHPPGRCEGRLPRVIAGGPPTWRKDASGRRRPARARV